MHRGDDVKRRKEDALGQLRQIGVVQSQGKERRGVTAVPQIWETHGTDSPSELSEGMTSADTLISDFLPLGLSENAFLWC